MHTLSFIQLSNLQATQFFKRRSNWLVLIIFLLAGGYALYQGYADKIRKTSTIQAFRAEKDSLLQDVKAGIVADTSTREGKAKYSKSAILRSGLWNTRLPSYKLPVSTAVYNMGQGDVFTYYYLFSAENFEMQLLKQTEITNPLRALAGHFDTSFWVVYLLPLMILLLTFNALSLERDNNNWRLISSQGITEKSWLQSKFFVVAILCLSLLLLIAVSGSILNAATFKQAPSISDVLFFATAVIYLFFWLSLFYFINSLRKPTTYNALVSGIAWIGICLVMPVAVSKLAEILIPVDSSEISTFSRRPQNPKIEDDKAFGASLIKDFATHYPAYRNANTDTASPFYIQRTYHAWHAVLTKKRWPVLLKYFDLIERRQQFTNWSTVLNPASSTDGFLTALADNDAVAYHRFTEQTKELHQSLDATFYPALFNGSALSKKEYGNLPQFHYRRSAIPLSLLGYAVLLTALSFLLWMKASKNLTILND